ncbi:MAG: SUMF1/EgtB/PvdO family nonheme iron enzyme [Bacteroidetes bacterium]|nr:SUMF1/EgtB/PvdO family nonheme iron enzyme [Bacteroidota bacterium]
MLELAKLKQSLRELVTDEGMEAALKALEKHLPSDVPKFNALLQLRARLNEIDNQRIKNVVSNEQATLQYDKLRDDILTFFSALQESDFSLETAKKANLGGVLYRIPERMQHLKKSKCIVRVAFDESVLKDTLDTEVDVVIEALKVSKNMEVKLVDEEGDGEYFEISSRSTPEQFLEQDEYTEWIFFVKPLEIGSYPLALIISLVIYENGKDRKKDITLERTINVISEPVPEEAGDHTLRKAGILFALRDPSKKPAGKPPKKKTWTKIAAGVLLLGILLWWLLPKFLNPGFEGVGSVEAKDFEQACKQNSPEAMIGFLAKYEHSQFDRQAKELVSKLLPKINLDSAVQVYRKTHGITPTDLGPEGVSAGGQRSVNETDPPVSTAEKLPEAVKLDSVNKLKPSQIATGGTDSDGSGEALANDSENLDPKVVPVSTTANEEFRSRWKEQDKATNDPLNWLPATMVKVKGGTFKMGCNVTKEGQCTGRAEPYHEVKINEFYISRFEVSQSVWKSVMGKNPSHFDDCELCPVEQVSWNDVQKFIEKLNKLQPGCNYRLPTEAEWEYAARQLGKEQIRFGDGTSRANPDNINFSTKDLPGRSTEQAGIDRERTVSIYDLKANSLGLYHMSGNVWEWVQDRWHDDYVGAPNDGSAWVDGNDKRRVLRGGSWNMEPFQTYNRDSKNANRGDDEVGFRLVCEVVCGE